MMKTEIVAVTCPTCKCTIKYVKDDPPRRCICCTNEAELKNEASRMKLAGATVVEGKPLVVETKGGK